MFYYLITTFIPNYKMTPLRLIDYVTFRAGAGLLTAMLIGIIFGPLTVRLLKKAIAPPRLDAELMGKDRVVPQGKDKTPSMGGLLVVASILIATLLWSQLTNVLLLLFLGTLLAFTAVGFADDYLKIVKHNRDGMPGKMKLLCQFVIAIVSLYLFSKMPGLGESFCQLCVPFVKQPIWIMPYPVAMLFTVLVVVGASNAVNLTDGKDGLAVGCTIFCVLTYGAFAYMCGHKIFAEHLDLNFIPGAAEIVVLTMAIAGASIGFLWHNCFPASMFMGDTGSLALGGIIGLVAVLVNQEILLVLVGGVFVMEITSVMLQVAYFKLTHGKRIFLCTPIHHHFEQLGWKETQIVVRFWILAGIFALLGLATLKLR